MQGEGAASEAKVMGEVKLTIKAQAELKRQKRAQRINNEKYFRVHPELREMTSAFISALLVDKPDDVHLYAEQFFTNPELAHTLGKQGWSRPVSPEPDYLPAMEEEFDAEELDPGISGATGDDVVDLEQLLISLFKEADKDGSGSLDLAEFEELMTTANLGLSKQELKMILADIDEDQNAQISYSEFVPLAVEVRAPSHLGPHSHSASAGPRAPRPPRPPHSARSSPRGAGALSADGADDAS